MSFQAPRPVLEGIGIGQPLNFSGWYQGQQFAAMRQNRADRLKLSQEGRRNQTMQETTSYLDKMHMHDGTPYDPVITQAYGGLLQQAAQMASEGKDFSTIMTQITPSVAQLNGYSQKAQAISKNIKETLARVPKDQGYDAAALEDEAKNAAFYDKDPKTGEKILKSPDTIDADKNYVLGTIKDHPDLVTNMSGWDNYFKTLPKHQTDKNVTTVTGPGKTNTQRVRVNANAFEDFDKDDNGNIKMDETGAPTGLVPKFQVVKDGDGKPIVDPDSGQPMRVMDDGLFNQLTTDRPGLSDALRGATKKHFQAVQKEGDPEISENDPKFRLYAKHLAYQKASELQNSSYSFLDKDAQSAQSTKLDPEMQKEQLAFNTKNAAATEQARLDVQNRDIERHPENYKTARGNKASDEESIEPIAQIFTNPHGVLANEPVIQKGGHDVVDVSPLMHGGKFNFAAGAKNQYSGMYYNPAAHQLELYKPGQKDPEIITSQNASQFLNRVAEVNGTNRSDVKGIMQKYKFSSGAFNQDPAQVQKNMAAQQQATQQANVGKVDTFIQSEDPGKIKGFQTPDGTVTDASVRGRIKQGIGMDKYSIDIKTKDGKTLNKTFKDENALKTYLGIKPVSAEDLINKYLPK